MGVYTGIAQDNVTINSGKAVLQTLTVTGALTASGGVAGTLTGDVDATAGYIQLRTATDVQIAAIANAVNTAGKAAGTIVFDTTNSKLKIATGANANSTWVDADGTNAVTPA
jgi:2-keto-3-deoxy-L-rhamnonate aldolase RhmA